MIWDKEVTFRVDPDPDHEDDSIGWWKLSGIEVDHGEDNPEETDAIEPETDYEDLEPALESAYRWAGAYSIDQYEVVVLVDGVPVGHEGSEREFVARAVKKIDPDRYQEDP